MSSVRWHSAKDAESLRSSQAVTTLAHCSGMQTLPAARWMPSVRVLRQNTLASVQVGGWGPYTGPVVCQGVILIDEGQAPRLASRRRPRQLRTNSAFTFNGLHQQACQLCMTCTCKPEGTARHGWSRAR